MAIEWDGEISKTDIFNHGLSLQSKMKDSKLLGMV